MFKHHHDFTRVTRLWIHGTLRSSHSGNPEQSELIAVGLFQEIKHRLGRFRLPQETAEIVVSQMAGNVFQRPQMIAGPLVWRDQQEENMDRLSIEAGKKFASS